MDRKEWFNLTISDSINLQKQSIKRIEKYVDYLDKVLICEHDIVRKRTNITEYYCKKCSHSVKIANHLDENLK